MSRRYSFVLTALTLSLMLVLTLSNIQNAAAETGNERFHVHLTQNSVEGMDWPVGASVIMTIDDPSNGANIDFTDTKITDSNGTALFNDVGGIDLTAGMYVTMNDGTTYKDHTVTIIALTGVDPDADTVSGTSAPGVFINTWAMCGQVTATRYVYADGNGNWTADYSVVGVEPEEQELCNIGPGSYGGAMEPDGNGDHTDVEWHIINPRISADPVGEGVGGWEWPLGAIVNIEVEDPATTLTPDVSGTATVFLDPAENETKFHFDIVGNYDLKVGDIVTVTDGTTTKSTVVTNLAVTDTDFTADVIAGTADVGAEIFTEICDHTGCYYRTVTTDGANNWFADYSVPGALPWENYTFNILPGMSGFSRQSDADGDNTGIHWRIPNTRISARFNENAIEGFEWTEGVLVALEVDDPATLDPVDYSDSQMPYYPSWDPQNTYLRFEMDGFTLAPGHIVTMSNGTTVKELTIADVQVTNWDIAADTITGIAPPLSDVWVNVWVENWTPRHVQADANGDWIADYGTFGDEDFEQFTYNIIVGSNGDASVEDADYDSSSYTWDTYTIWVPPGSIPLNVAIGEDINLERPSYTTHHWAVLNLLYEPLFRLGDNATVVPAGATGYTVSANGLVYTFTLRANKWSDNVPTRASHYVNGILRILHPDTATDYAFMLFDIQGAEGYNNGTITDPNAVGVKALNDTTLQITLAHPAVYFPKILTTPGITAFRADIADLYEDAWTDPSHFVANGPYKLLEHDGAHLLLGKNTLYYNTAKVAFSQIGLPIYRDTNEPFEAYKRGEIDVVMEAPASAQTDPLYRFERVYSESPGIYYLGLNVQRAPTDDVLVRQALAAATDRRAILDDVLNTPWRQTASGVIPPELPGYQGDAVGFPYNPTLAQDLLAQAGYPGGVGLPTVHIYNNIVPQPIIEAIAEQWRTVLGISVEVHYISNYGTYMGSCINNVGACEYNAFRAGWLIDYYDTHNIINDLFNPDTTMARRTGWDDARYRELIELSRAEQNTTLRIAYLQEAEQILVEEDTAVIPLYFLDRVSLVKPGFQTAFGVVPYFEKWSYQSVSAPSAFNKSSPVNNALKIPANPTLKWGTSTSTVEYEYCIDTTSDNACDVPWVTTTTTSVPLTGLAYNQMYYWQVRALNAVGTTDANAGAWWNFTVVMPPPDSLTPGNLYPGGNADNVHTKRPTFTWTEVTGASSYTVEVATTAYCTSFARKVFSGTASTTSYIHTADLLSDTVYCWRVRANGTNGPGGYSQTRIFSTGNPPSVPALLAPANNGLVTTHSPLFDWADSTLPSGENFLKYQYELATDVDFENMVEDGETGAGNINASSFLPTNPLDAGTTYYWHVRAWNVALDVSAWSVTRSVRIAFDPPVLFAPGNLYPAGPADNIHTRRPTFTWAAVSGATGYSIEVASSAYCATFSTKAINTTSATNSFIPPTDLLANTVYCWRVRANGTYGPSGYSQVFTFKTANPPSTPVLAAPTNNILLTTTQRPVFDWNNSTLPSGATFDRYEFHLDTTSTFPAPFTKLISGDITNSTYTMEIDLTPANTYYWRVRACNAGIDATPNNADDDCSGWSLVRSVRISYTKPELNSPVSGTTVPSLKPTFTWNIVVGATSYKIQISAYSSFGTYLVNTTVTGGATTYTATTNLTAHKTLYWRVQALGLYGPSAWSNVWTFITP